MEVQRKRSSKDQVYMKLRSKYGLSNREAQIAVEAASGINIADTADKFFIGIKTVKFHRTNIFKKMNVSGYSRVVAIVAELTLTAK